MAATGSWCQDEAAAVNGDRNAIGLVLANISPALYEDDSLAAMNSATRANLGKSVVVIIDLKLLPRRSDRANIPNCDLIPRAIH
jgi:hypothetical protein